MSKTWMWILFIFSAFFFVVATYSLVMLLVAPISSHAVYVYRVIAGYFLFVILSYIANSKRKKYNRKLK